MSEQRASAMIRLVPLLCLVLSLASCTSLKEAPPDSRQLFQIAMLRGDEISRAPGLGSTIESSWPVLQKAFPSGSVHSITPDDIEMYEWADQTITLTAQASTTVAKVLQKETPQTLWGFVVVVDGKPLYGGVFTYPMTARSIGYPVIYEDEADGRVTFTIRPYHSVLGIPQDDPAWQGIRDSRVKSIFSELGKLR